MGVEVGRGRGKGSIVSMHFQRWCLGGFSLLRCREGRGGKQNANEMR